MPSDKKIREAIDGLAKQIKDHSKGTVTSEEAHKIASNVARKKDRKGKK